MNMMRKTSLIVITYCEASVLLPLFVFLCLPGCREGTDYDPYGPYDRQIYNSRNQNNPYGEYHSNGISVRCWKCDSNNPESPCFRGEETASTSTASKDSDNMVSELCESPQSFCYVWHFSMGSGITTARGCAESNHNPCLGGPNYDVCQYRLCTSNLCNSSKIIRPSRFLVSILLIAILSP